MFGYKSHQSHHRQHAGEKRGYVRELKGEKLRCPDCDYTTSNSSSLKAHSSKHVEPALTCSIQYPDKWRRRYYGKECNYKTMNSSSLSAHTRSCVHKYQRNHCDFKARDYLENCDCTTSRAIHKEAHLLTHTNERMRCKHCGHAANTPNCLSAHYLQHNNGRKLRCKKHCEFTTTSASALEVHSHKHSLGKACRTWTKDGIRYLEPPKTPIYYCKDCDYMTECASNMKPHSRTHTGELLSCKLCKYRYTTVYPAEIKSHSLRHCEANFRSRQKVHYYRHHCENALKNHSNPKAPEAYGPKKNSQFRYREIKNCSDFTAE